MDASVRGEQFWVNVNGVTLRSLETWQRAQRVASNWLGWGRPVKIMRTAPGLRNPGWHPFGGIGRTP